MINQPNSNGPNDADSSANKHGLDEKTALLIDQTDKSLKQMEQNLGPDNPVIAQLLDTYAGILRQNNIRHLDAINMEARAKAIRAKHNIPQPIPAGAPRLSEELEFAEQPKTMSAGQVATIFWGGAIVVTVGLFYFSYQTLKPAVPKKAVKQTVVEPAPSAEDTAPKSRSSSAPAEAPVASESEEKAPAEDEKVEAVKQKILEAYNTGQSLEQSGDADGALDSYRAAAEAAVSGSNDTGKTIATDPLARSFDGMAKILRDKGDESAAADMERQASNVRTIIQRLGE